MKRKVWELTVLDNPNRAVGGESDIFYTTDTEAFLIFRLTDDDFNPTTATLTLVNTSDKSVISESVPVIDKEIEWEMFEDAIAHSGNWQAQLVYTQEKAGKPERYTAPVIQFDVQNHLLTGRQPSLVAIEDWNTFMATAQELLNQLEEEAGGIFIDIDELEQQYRDNEQARADAENVREANESTRQAEESQREASEQQREENESLRESSETDRVSAEQNRVTAESERNDLYDLVQQKLENGEFVGEKGNAGDGLEYIWNGTQLGVRKEGETEYVYVDLKGDKGDPGEMENFDSSHIVDALGYMPISATDIPDPTWDNLQDKPLEFTPIAHTHSIDDVTGLRDELDSVPELTKENVGLGNVDNVKQASKVEHDQLATSLDEHQAEEVHQGELHGFRLTDGKLEYFDGTEWQRVKGDGYPVGNVSSFNAQPDDRQITLTWTDPDDVTIEDSNGSIITIARWKGTKILRKAGSYPQNENDGVLVVDNGVKNQYKTNGFTDTGLINDTDYYYMAFPYTEDDVYTVDENNRISAIPTEIKIYGVEIDESNSNPETSVVYTDDAVGFTPAKGNNGDFEWGTWENVIKEEFGIRPVVLQNLGGGNAEVNYPLQYDDYTKKADGSNSDLTGTDGDVMIEFGTPLWWRFNRVGSKLKIQLSSKEFDGAVKHAFEIEDGYNQMSIYPLFLTQIIYLLMFKNLDSQTALGRGRVDYSSANYADTGRSNSDTFNYGETTGQTHMKFLGMEDYYGNRRWWIDGCFYDASRNILIGTNNFNDTGSGYENFGLASSADLNGYIDKVQGKNNTGFIPASTSGSATTYYADYGIVSSGRLPDFGGASNYGDVSGAFYLFSSTASGSSAYVGGRLFYSNGDDKIYIGAYLGVSQSNKLRSISGQESHNSATIGAFRTLAKANNN